MHRVRTILIALIVPVTVVLLWQLFSPAGGRLPQPSAILPALSRLVTEGDLGLHLVASLRRVGTGYGLAVVIALPLAVFAGLARPAIREWIEDVVGVFRPIPPLAWMALSVLWFGLSDGAAVFVIALAASLPIFTNSLHGLRETPRDCIEAARTLGARRSDVIRHVWIPSALPAMLTGLRISAGLSLAVIIGAELVIGYTLKSGIGYLFVKYVLVRFNPANVLALMLVVGVIGLVLDAVLRKLQNRLTGWSPSVIESR